MLFPLRFPFYPSNNSFHCDSHNNVISAQKYVYLYYKVISIQLYFITLFPINFKHLHIYGSMEPDLMWPEIAYAH